MAPILNDRFLLFIIRESGFWMASKIKPLECHLNTGLNLEWYSDHHLNTRLVIKWWSEYQTTIWIPDMWKFVIQVFWYSNGIQTLGKSTTWMSNTKLSRIQISMIQIHCLIAQLLDLIIGGYHPYSKVFALHKRVQGRAHLLLSPLVNIVHLTRQNWPGLCWGRFNKTCMLRFWSMHLKVVLFF